MMHFFVLKTRAALSVGVIALAAGTECHAAEVSPVTLEKVTCPPDTVVYDLEDSGKRIFESRKPLFFVVSDSNGFKSIDSATATETPRRAQILVDIDTLKNGLAREAGPESCARYMPQQLRSTLEVSAKTVDGSDHKKTYVVGPPEHLYLTFSAPVTDIKQLKYDSTTHSVVERNAPTSFYLGIAYKWGDLYAESGSFSLDRVTALALVRASSKPTSSVGFGIGYSTHFCDVFVARVSTAPDSTATSTTSARKWSTIGGLSFNIANAIGWLTGK